MKAEMLAVVALVCVTVVYAEPKAKAKAPRQNLLEKIFSPKVKPTPAPRKKRVPARKSSTTTASEKPSSSKPIRFKVDTEWLAKYRVLEAIWDYQIPEDDGIFFYDGAYYVPANVYRHYEDMSNVTPQQALPTPTPKPKSEINYRGSNSWILAGIDRHLDSLRAAAGSTD